MEADLDFLNDLRPQPEAETAAEAIIRLIDNDKVVPIVGNALVNELMIGSHDALVKRWESWIKYPQSEQGHKLARMTQFASISQAGDSAANETRIKYRYNEFLKAALQAKAKRDAAVEQARSDDVEEEAPRLTVSDMARRFDYPHLDDDETNPLLLLAALPLSIFVTTCFHETLEDALRTKPQQKAARTEVFRWRDGLDSIPSIFDREPDYEPTPQQPLVYHLHGLDRYPESLVLTEDDHLDFLTNIFREGRNIHPRVRQALTESSLVLIGYHPREWDFRTVFRGVIRPRPQSILKDNVYIQVDRSDGHMADYLEKYMRQSFFEVQWCEPANFIRELYQGWQAR